MPRASILRRVTIWKLDDKIISEETDVAYPTPNRRYQCFCGQTRSRKAFMEHFPACKRENLGED